MDFKRRYYQRQQRQAIDRLGRPGRQGQATVGHEFLTRPALTKTNPFFDTAVAFDAVGAATTSTYAHYGVSTYGDGDVYGEQT